MRAKIYRKEGVVSLTPETFEDLWHVYKIITPGAKIKSRTARKYKPPGGGKEERIGVYAVVEAEKVELHRHSNRVRVTGRIVEIKPEYIAPLGAYHTIDVEIGKEVKIEKEWKGYELDRVKEAVSASRRRLMTIALMDYEEALFAALRQYGVDFGVEIRNRAKKRKGESVEMGEFFKEVADEIQKCEGLVLVGGPGFVKENFYEYLKREMPEVAKRVRVVSASNAERSGVYELLKSEEMQKIMEDEHMHTVFRDVERFLKSVGKGDGLSAYGREEIERAVESGAVEKIIVLDSNVREDEFYEKMLDGVKKKGGEIRIVPEESQIAEQIRAFGGAIALLRFRVA